MDKIILDNYRNRMDKLMESDDTDEAHQYADQLLVDMIVTLARYAKVTDVEAMFIGKILEDFDEMDKWYA